MKNILKISACFICLLSASGFASADNAKDNPSNKPIMSFNDEELKEEINVFLPEELVQKIKKDKKDLAQKGYMERLEEPTRAEYIKARMKERRSMADLKGKQLTFENLGFENLDNIVYADLPFMPTMLDQKYFSKSSENFILLGTNKIKQLYSKTKFGTLIIDEIIGDEVVMNEPNTEVFGSPAMIVSYKHKGEKWATVLSVAHNETMFIIESDKHLKKKARDEFISMANELISMSVRY